MNEYSDDAIGKYNDSLVNEINMQADIIKNMAEWIDRNSGETICKEMIDNKRDRLRAECQVIGCVDCIIQYFEWIGKLK